MIRKEKETEIRQSPKSYRIDTVTINPPTLTSSMKRDDGNVRIKEAECPSICMPKCEGKCLAAYMFINNENYPFYMNPNIYSTSKSISESVPLCHPHCMPKCQDSCLTEIPSVELISQKIVCRQACMPKCSPACVTSPPPIIPCERPLMNPKKCDCAPGYVQCSNDTCCMKYKKMAIKYRNLLPSYLDADDENNIKNVEKVDMFLAKDGLIPDYVNGNETNIYINLLRRLGNFNKIEKDKTLPDTIEGSGI
uniref:CC domain-containing protein n=1 Tax=Parastrongyloides trichosuri TaxID=131310 RepID=A0A0N4Z4T7_PARTI